MTIRPLFTLLWGRNGDQKITRQMSEHRQESDGRWQKMRLPPRSASNISHTTINIRFVIFSAVARCSRSRTSILPVLKGTRQALPVSNIPANHQYCQVSGAVQMMMECWYIFVSTRSLLAKVLFHVLYSRRVDRYPKPRLARGQEAETSAASRPHAWLPPFFEAAFSFTV